MLVRKLLIGFIATVQFVLFLTHFLLYETWTFSSPGIDSHGTPWIELVLGFLSISLLPLRYLLFAIPTPLCARFTGLPQFGLGCSLSSSWQRFLPGLFSELRG